MHRSGLSFAFQPQLLFTVLALFAILPVTPVVSSRPMFKKGCSVLKFKPTTAASLQSAISMMRALVLGALPTPRYAMYQTGCLVSLNPVMCLYPQPVLWSELALGGALCCVFLILLRVICQNVPSKHLTLSAFGLQILTGSQAVRPR